MLVVGHFVSALAARTEGTTYGLVVVQGIAAIARMGLVETALH